jgi:2-amino-4-hydroxy-6-hydroxymethyldihydropteridine diphosphokinase
MPFSKEIYVAVGSNLPNPMGSPILNVLKAIQLLKSDIIKVVGCSDFYETVAQPNYSDPPFINAVVALETNIKPEDLLHMLLAIENKLGRIRTAQNAPRTIDLDLLAYGQEIIASDFLHLPHPKIAERIFVLKPWHDLNPAWVHPVFRQTVQKMLDSVFSQYHLIKKIRLPENN